MRRLGPCRASVGRAAVLLSLLGVLAAPVGVDAQEAVEPSAASVPQRTPAEALATAVVPAAEVSARSAELDELLRTLRVRAAESPAVAEIAERLAVAEESWTRLAAEAISRLQQPTPGTAISELDLTWANRADLAADWDRGLAGRIQQLTVDLELLDQREALWGRTLDRAREDALPPEVEKGIRESLVAIAMTRTVLKQRRNEVLTIQSRIAEQQRIAAGVLEAVGAARVELRGSLLRRDAPPLWRMSSDVRPGELVRQLSSAWSRDLEDLRLLLLDGGAVVVNVGLTFLALLGALVFLRTRARRRVAEAPAFEATVQVLSRPGSAAFLVLILLLPSLVPTAPRILRLAIGLVLVVPVLRLIVPIVRADLRPTLFVLVAWYLLDWVRVAFEPAPGLARLLLLFESLASGALFAWLLLPSRLSHVESATPWLYAIGLLVRVALVLLTLAVVSNVAGNLSLAELLTESTLFAAYVAVVLYGSGRVLFGIWVVLLQTQPLRFSRGVQRHETLLVQRGARIIEVALAALWVWIALGRFDVREPVVAAVQSVLSASWPMGDLELGLGDLVAFGVTLYVAMLLSRFIRFVLDEDVLPRASLPRGVPYAISSATNYAILIIGFLLAVSAAGFDMSRFALIVGALGVGIGIGLQDVVNNFVSGLILLFERPVQTGDVVDLATISGEVRRIGMRSSTIRTWDGAEVIVPNSKLVSESLINWTLSDRLRRITVPIGVAYGTDPERVLALLAEVAKAHPDVLATPAPMCLFVAHGESSLDFELRAWTARFEEWLRVRTELTVAVNRTLREAQIEVPFPQRDLHLRSVEPELAGLLDRERDDS